MKTSLLIAVAAACQAGRCGATLCGYDSCGEQPLYQCSLDYCSTMTSMDLSDMGLTGTIPPSFSLLTNLASLKLANNSLTGPLPPGMGSLHSLHQLYLDGNTLTGTLPPSLGSLAALQYLDVLGNDFTGSIPAAVGSLTHLQTLDVSQNYLGGLLPDSICNLQDTTSLRLNNNYCFDETVAVDNTVTPVATGISYQDTYQLGSCGSTTWYYAQANFTFSANSPNCEYTLGPFVATYRRDSGGTAMYDANGDHEYAYFPRYIVATQFFNVTTCNFEQLRIQQFDCPLPASCADWLSAQSQVGSCFVDYAVVEDMDTQLSVVASGVDEQAATIDSLQQTVSEQAATIASLQSDGDTLQQTVSEQAATIASLQSDGDTLQQTASEQAATIASLQSDAEALLQTTSEQATAIASLQTNADSMDQAFSEQAVAIEALQAANGTLQQTLSAHAATIMSLQSDGDARQQTLSAQATTIVSLQSENDVLQQTVSEQQATIALLQSDIEDAQQTVSDQASTIASMQGDVDDAQLTVLEQASAMALLESNVTAMQISLASVHDFVLRMNWTFTQQLLPSNFVPASTNPPPCTNDADADGHDAMPCVSTTATTPAATPESTMPIRSVVMTTAPAVHSATSTHNVILFSSIAGVGVVCIATIVTVVLCVKRHGKYSPGSTAGKGATTDGVLQQREIMMQNIVTRDISTLILTKSTIDFSENARCIGAGGAGRVFEACTRKGRTAPNGVFVAKGTAVVRSCMWL